MNHYVGLYLNELLESDNDDAWHVLHYRCAKAIALGHLWQVCWVTPYGAYAFSDYT